MDVVESESMYSKHLLQGWSLSLLLHLGLVVAAMTMMPKMTIVPEEPFTWDVALVEPSSDVLQQDNPAPTPKVQAFESAQVQPVRPVEPLSETVMPRVAPQQSSEMVHPVIEPPKPLQPVQPVQEIVQAQSQPAEPQEVKKAEVKEPEPVAKEVVKQEAVQEPVREVAPVIEPAAPTYSYPAPAASQPTTEAHHDSVAVASAPPAPIAEPAPISPSSPASVAAPKASDESPAPVSAPQAGSTPSKAPTQVAKAVPQTPSHTSEAKADHRWVGESLWRRVAELKRYPSSARLNGLEGRVVLKAVIRADGQLAEVTVIKSSGHAILDAAAMETVRLATPLAMTQPLKRPEIVVSLPIVYSLSN